ncbi:MAG: phosphoribosylformylglycinamidine synthase subunit PurQ, partial [Anaerolineae bacterium]
HPDIRSKEDVIRRYDHEVQGGTAVKPLTGQHNHGPSDAAVLVPQNCQWSMVNRQLPMKGVALANGIRPNYTTLDPYRMAWAAVDEAFRNVTAVGADPDQVSLLDNFCWGNPNLPDRLGELVRCAQGCYDAAVAYNAPFISGKDSLNNEYTGGDGRKHAIPGTLLISALGIVPDINQTVTMDWKQAGNHLYIIGDTWAELGGSHFQQGGGAVQPQHNVAPRPVPNVLDRMRALHQAIRAGLVQACHDLSEGGLAVALAEMALAGSMGAEIQLNRVPRNEWAAYADDEAILFSETLSRFLVEVRPEDAPRFEAIMAGHSHNCIGVLGGDRLRIAAMNPAARETYLLDVAVAELEGAWLGKAGEQRGRGAEEQGSKVQRLEGVHPSSFILHPSVLILHANGTNRDHDAALACELAGGQPEIVHVNQLLAGERRLTDYAMLVIPGGFSYGDDLGAGVLWAQDLRHGLGEALFRFVADGRPVLGICNGFQALVKAGILPGIQNPKSKIRNVTLTYNENGRFECRWVWLQPDPHSPGLFTQGLNEPIYCPVAHGEGRLMVRDEETLAALETGHLIPLRYAGEHSTINNQQSTVNYPANPNGSVLNAAALCNAAGNVMGLMPHPENHIFPWQHPRHTRGAGGSLGLKLFENGIKRS